MKKMDMVRACMWVAVSGAIASAGTSSAQEVGGFADCESARNFGVNTAQQFTSAVLNRVAWNPVALDPAEVALAGAVKKLSALATSDPDSHKVCYSNGFFIGYTRTLSSEYAQCRARSRVFERVSAVSLARAAEAVFVGLYTSLDGELSESTIDAVFADGVLGEGSVAACRRVILDGVAADLGRGADLVDLADHLAGLLCTP